jgi:hypothetical protein
MSNTPLYDSLFPSKYKEDDFGYSQEWNEEIEKWLACAIEVDESRFVKEKNRVKKAKQRNELLGEYKAVYVAKKIWNAKNILFTDEENATEQIVDFTFDDADGENWKAEVKSSSWEAELAADSEKGTITKEQFLKRKEQPQYINAEVRTADFNIFRNPISSSINKFKKGDNNLLFLCPNTFGPLYFFGKLHDWHQLRQIIAELDTDQKISAICYLTVNLNMDGFFNYLDHLIQISHLPAIGKSSSN